MSLHLQWAGAAALGVYGLVSAAAVGGGRATGCRPPARVGPSPRGVIAHFAHLTDSYVDDCPMHDYELDPFTCTQLRECRVFGLRRTKTATLFAL